MKPGQGQVVHGFSANKQFARELVGRAKLGAGTDILTGLIAGAGSGAISSASLWLGAGFGFGAFLPAVCFWIAFSLVLIDIRTYPKRALLALPAVCGIWYVATKAAVHAAVRVSGKYTDPDLVAAGLTGGAVGAGLLACLALLIIPSLRGRRLILPCIAVGAAAGSPLTLAVPSTTTMEISLTATLVAWQACMLALLAGAAYRRSTQDDKTQQAITELARFGARAADKRRSADVRAVVTLVHGTFARGAAWCQEGSPVCEAIRARFGDSVVIDVFEWSGSVQHEARVQAGRELIEHAKRLIRRYPERPYFLVGHSHGGNVIRYSLRDPEIRSATTGVVAMATPFLDVLPRPFERQLLLLIRACVVQSYILGALLAFALLVHTSAIAHSADPLLVKLLNKFGGKVLGFIAALLIGGMLIFYSQTVGIITSEIKSAMYEARARLYDDWRFPDLSDLPVLTLTTAHDEAALGLSAARGMTEWIYSAIVSRLWQMIGFFLVLPFSAIALYSVVAGERLFAATGEMLKAYAIALSAQVALLPLLVAGQLVASLYLPRWIKGSIFGDRRAYESWVLDIANFVNPVGWQPCFTYKAQIRKWDRSRWSSLKHSLVYSDRLAIDTMMTFLLTLTTPTEQTNFDTRHRYGITWLKPV
jgi:hypothetical protein